MLCASHSTGLGPEFQETSGSDLSGPNLAHLAALLEAACSGGSGGAPPDGGGEVPAAALARVVQGALSTPYLQRLREAAEVRSGIAGGSPVQGGSAEEEGVLLIGSGSLTHNLYELSRSPRVIDAPVPDWVSSFGNWVTDRVEAGALDDVIAYRERGPHAAENHPSEEHFLPLPFAMAAAGENARDGVGGARRKRHHQPDGPGRP